MKMHVCILLILTMKADGTKRKYGKLELKNFVLKTSSPAGRRVGDKSDEEVQDVGSNSEENYPRTAASSEDRIIGGEEVTQIEK